MRPGGKGISNMDYPYYLEVKALHIMLVTSWFAGLFYLSRIFVNLAMVPAESVAERDRLLLMAGKIYRFMTPIGYLALVVGLVGYNHYCNRLLNSFRDGSNTRSHVWFRWFNEVPALALLIVVLLVVLKPL